MHKILFISPLPPPEGGIATWTKKIFQYGLSTDSRLFLVNTQLRGKRNIFDRFNLSFSEIKRTFKIFNSLLYQLIINRPKVTHLNSSLSSFGIFRDLACALLSKLLGIPVITHYHGNIADFKMKYYPLSHIGLKLLMRISDINIVMNQCSLSAAKIINKNYKKLKLILLPNFIEDKIFDYCIPTKCANTKIRAIFAGGITKTKGCLEILEASKIYPEIEFHLFGKMHDDVAEFFKQLPDNIILHGVKNHDVLFTEMQLSDFLLFPSHSEGFPQVVLEAMAVGLPIIATRVGAIPEMIAEGKGGLLVQPRDLKSLILAIKAIATNQALRMNMGLYNREKSFNDYRYSIVIDKLIKIYQQFF